MGEVCGHSEDAGTLKIFQCTIVQIKTFSLPSVPDNEQDDVVLDSQMNNNRTDFRLCAWETIQPKENKQTRTERSNKPGLIPE